jgi:hypothetical protein
VLEYPLAREHLLYLFGVCELEGDARALGSTQTLFRGTRFCIVVGRRYEVYGISSAVVDNQDFKGDDFKFGKGQCDEKKSA